MIYIPKGVLQEIHDTTYLKSIFVSFQMFLKVIESSPLYFNLKPPIRAEMQRATTQKHIPLKLLT